jgi:hypothetical protein
MNKLNGTAIKYVNAILLNDENSSDEELVSLFVEELKISKELSEKIVSFRDKALLDITFDINEFEL